MQRLLRRNADAISVCESALENQLFVVGLFVPIPSIDASVSMMTVGWKAANSLIDADGDMVSSSSTIGGR